MNKSYFIDYLTALSSPLLPHFQQNPAQPLPISHVAVYSDGATHSESFSRPLWGLAPYLASSLRDNKALDATQTEWLALYRKGLLLGTDPAEATYWGDLPLGQPSQHCVEMAGISYALLLLQEPLWHSYSHAEQQQIYTWLNQINQSDGNVVDNNWRFFRLLVNSFFKKNQLDFRQQQMDHDIAEIESMYLGDGWYQDGHHNQRDYYIPMAMHYYGLFYATLFPTEAQSKIYRERALKFAPYFLAWFSESGEALPFGRSLTYRFAQVAFFSAYAVAGLCDEADGLSHGEVKGIIKRHLDYWQNQEITVDGILQVGYSYANLFMSESYNAVGSPYWAFKSFILLSLPQDHAFWQAPLQDLPKKKEKQDQPHAHMRFSRDKEGHVYALSAGQYATFEPKNNKEKYAKFLYSSSFGFNITNYDSASLENYAADSVLSLSLDKIHWNHRGKTYDHVQNEKGLCSSWRLNDSVSTRTLLYPVSAHAHLRFHRIFMASDACVNDFDFIDGGASTPYSSFHSPLIKEPLVDANSVLVSTQWKDKYYHSYMLSLNNTAHAEVLRSDVNTNIISPHSLIPILRGSGTSGENLLVSYAEYSLSSQESPWQAPVITMTSDANGVYTLTINNEKLQINLNEWMGEAQC